MFLKKPELSVVTSGKACAALTNRGSLMTKAVADLIPISFTVADQMCVWRHFPAFLLIAVVGHW